jgi:hypothetical protein
MKFTGFLKLKGRLKGKPKFHLFYSLFEKYSLFASKTPLYSLFIIGIVLQNE